MIVIAGFIFIFLSVYWFGILAVCVFKYQSISLTQMFDYELLFFDEHHIYFYFLTFIALGLWLDVVYTTYFSKKQRDKRKKKRKLSHNEQVSITHLATKHEAKKGLLRLEIDKGGEIKHNTILDYVDAAFDPLKRFYNLIVGSNICRKLFKTTDINKLNIRHTYIVGERKNKRGGLPIITKKNKLYVDPTDSHTMIIGTTNSGKTYSVIHILISTCAMAGESMIINDIKGELYRMHGKELEEKGYQIININFVNPKASSSWNPLGIIINKWRQAEMEASRSGAEPNYSEALELLKDIANTLTYEKSAKDPFWNAQAGILFEGLVCFLLEEKVMDPETGEMIPLPDEMINSKSIRMLHQQGNTLVSKDETLLMRYVKQYRKPDDQSRAKLTDYFNSPKNTKGSIDSVFANKMDLLTLNQDIMAMTSISEFKMQDIVKQKTAVFIMVQDEKKTYHPFVDIFITQLYEEVIKVARKESNLRLKYPLNIIYDEFGISKLKNIDDIMAAGRSRGVRMFMAIQDFAQIEENYNEKVAKAISNNVTNFVYLLGGDPETLKDVSKRAGDQLRWDKERETYQREPLLTPEKLSKFDIGDALFIRQRRNPFLTRLLPFNKYCFYQTMDKDCIQQEKELRPVLWFNIEDVYKRKIRMYENVVSNEVNVEESTGKFARRNLNTILNVKEENE